MAFSFSTVSSLLSLAPSGVFQRSLLPIEPVCSYHTFSPLPCYGGLFSVALSLGLPPPDVNWHCILVEPGLSSLNKIKAINHLSGNYNLLLNFKTSRKFILFFGYIFTNNKTFFINYAIYCLLSKSSLKSFCNHF